MGTRTKTGGFIAVVIWLLIFGALALAVKYYLMPRYKTKLTEQTGAESQYKLVIKFGLDSFSGYCIWRSEALARDLKTSGIKLEFIDDAADYAGRVKALKKRELQLAVFTVDSYLNAGAKIGDYPATIITVVDETKGGDGIISYKSAVASFDDLNSAEARFVFTPNSPSEFLARVIVAQLNLPNLPEKWWEEADGAQDVYRRFRREGKDNKKAYVLWQPYISRALAEDGAQVLFDTSKLNGYIIDVLVVERQFLQDNPELVKEVLAAYLRAGYAYSQTTDGLLKLVLEDAKQYGGEDLSQSQAQDIVSGIWWKNTLENYLHFGITAANSSNQVVYLEDAIGNIMTVLLKTGALTRDPLAGKYNQLFYPGVLRELQAENFHPGKKLNLVSGL